MSARVYAAPAAHASRAGAPRLRTLRVSAELFDTVIVPVLYDEQDESQHLWKINPKEGAALSQSLEAAEGVPAKQMGVGHGNKNLTYGEVTSPSMEVHVFPALNAPDAEFTARDAERERGGGSGPSTPASVRRVSSTVASSSAVGTPTSEVGRRKMVSAAATAAGEPVPGTLARRSPSGRRSAGAAAAAATAGSGCRTPLASSLSSTSTSSSSLASSIGASPLRGGFDVTAPGSGATAASGEAAGEGSSSSSGAVSSGMPVAASPKTPRGRRGTGSAHAAAGAPGREGGVDDTLTASAAAASAATTSSAFHLSPGPGIAVSDASGGGADATGSVRVRLWVGSASPSAAPRTAAVPAGGSALTLPPPLPLALVGAGGGAGGGNIIVAAAGVGLLDGSDEDTMPVPPAVARITPGRVATATVGSGAGGAAFPTPSATTRSSNGAALPLPTDAITAGTGKPPLPLFRRATSSDVASPSPAVGSGAPVVAASSARVAAALASAASAESPVGAAEPGHRLFAAPALLRLDDVFIDLGSGTGKIPLHAALLTQAGSCYGIEFAESRHLLAERAFTRLREWPLPQLTAALRARMAVNTAWRLQFADSDPAERATVRPPRDALQPAASEAPLAEEDLSAYADDLAARLKAVAPRVRAVHGNFLEYDFSDASVVFINNTVFEPTLMLPLLKRLAVHPNLRRLLLLRKICDRHGNRCVNRGELCHAFLQPPLVGRCWPTWDEETTIFTYAPRPDYEPRRAAAMAAGAGGPSSSSTSSSSSSAGGGAALAASGANTPTHATATSGTASAQSSAGRKRARAALGALVPSDGAEGTSTGGVAAAVSVASTGSAGADDAIAMPPLVKRARASGASGKAGGAAESSAAPAAAPDAAAPAPAAARALPTAAKLDDDRSASPPLAQITGHKTPTRTRPPGTPARPPSGSRVPKNVTPSGKTAAAMRLLTLPQEEYAKMMALASDHHQDDGQEAGAATTASSSSSTSASGSDDDGGAASSSSSSAAHAAPAAAAAAPAASSSSASLASPPRTGTSSAAAAAAGLRTPATTRRDSSTGSAHGTPYYTNRRSPHHPGLLALDAAAADASGGSGSGLHPSSTVGKRLQLAGAAAE